MRGPYDQTNTTGEEGPDPLQVQLIRLLLDARGGCAPAEDVIKGIPDLLRQRARQLDGADPTGSLRANGLHPGYLSRSCGDVMVHVPFPLVFAFPGERQLSDILALARTVSVGRDGCVCISGSSCFLGGITVVGDLDFCEYVFDGNELPTRVMRLIESGRDAMLCKVQCGRPFVAPWANCRQALQEFIEQGRPAPGERTRRLKLDFCGITETLGLLPASNIVIWLDPAAPEDGNALDSFAHQEAVIDRGNGVARTLVNARRLGAYLVFLRGQIDLFLPSSPVKSLKRALSLCGLLGLHLLYDECVDWLNHPVVEYMVFSKRIDELKDLIASSPSAETRRFERMLGQAESALDATMFDAQDAAETQGYLRLAAEVVREKVDELITWVETGDGSR